MRTLIIGGSGLLGNELTRHCIGLGHDVVATYWQHPQTIDGVRWHHLDLRKRAEVLDFVDQIAPDLIVNAAYLHSDWQTTADGAASLALAAEKTGARFVHVSSDAIFSGDAVTYDETAIPDPTSPYGAAKAAAETAVAAIAPGAVIARTSIIVTDGTDPQRLAPMERLVHRLVASPEDGVLFDDDIRCVVLVSDLAEALIELSAGTFSGIAHLAGADPVSRYELGGLIAKRDGLDAARLRTGSRAAAGILGPLDVRLDSRATQAKLATRLRGVRELWA